MSDLEARLRAQIAAAESCGCGVCALFIPNLREAADALPELLDALRGFATCAGGDGSGCYCPRCLTDQGEALALLRKYGRMAE